MSDWQWHIRPGDAQGSERHLYAQYVTRDGAAWLASASVFPHSAQALWAARPTAPSVLPCGTVFDAVSLPPVFGRRVLEQLWTVGPGSGPAAVHRGRVLLLVARGAAQRLPALLAWEEWGSAVPPLMCHSVGDAVAVPPLYGHAAAPQTAPGAVTGHSRWLVAPDTRHPWLPGAGVLLWACVRAARVGARGSGPGNTDFYSPRPGC